jgi:cyanate permease
VISFFSAMSAVASFGIGFLPRRWPLRYVMSVAAVALASGTLGLIGVHSVESAYLFAGMFGLGIGGVMTLLPMAWADYFGRESYGAIRGVALSLQVLAQAAGPIASGMLRDATGNYTDSLILLGVLGAMAAGVALVARRPLPRHLPPLAA